MHLVRERQTSRQRAVRVALVFVTSDARREDGTFQILEDNCKILLDARSNSLRRAENAGALPAQPLLRC